MGPIAKAAGAVKAQLAKSQTESPTATPDSEPRIVYRFGNEPKDVLVRAGIPARYRGARLKDFPDLDEGSIDWSRGGFFLQGNPGIGKTYLAAALAARRLRQDHPWTLAQIQEPDGHDENVQTVIYAEDTVGWISAPELLLKIRATFGGSATETEAQVVQRYVGFRLLVLDDLGAERVTDWSASTLYLIISKRDAELRDTIITSNASIGDIAKWEPRIASRVASMATIKLPDVDRRLTRRATA